MKKLTKYMVCLAAVLVVAAPTMGCEDKATGGGWFYDYDSGNKCTFGFNVQYKDNPGAVENEKVYTGQFQFKDHETGVKFHIEEMTSFSCWSVDRAYFAGNDKDGKFVQVIVLDAGEPGWGGGDGIAIWYDIEDVWEEDPNWIGCLGRGEIQTHP